MRVAIDKGHSKFTKGKEVSFKGSIIKEREMNEVIGNLVEKLLREKGIKTKDVSGSYWQDRDLGERCRQADDSDFYVSIHHNAFNTVAKGYEIFYYSEEGRKFADRVSFFMEHLKIANRGVKKNDFYVLKNTKPVAILIEVGFYDNVEELNYIMFHYEEIAKQIADGIYSYIKEVELSRLLKSR